jgi:hypothetical protein
LRRPPAIEVVTDADAPALDPRDLDRALARVLLADDSAEPANAVRSD